jgi:hypothetical protein
MFCLLRQKPRKSWLKANDCTLRPAALPVMAREGGETASSASNLKDDWGWKTWPSDLTWRPLKRGSDTRETYLTLVTGLSGTPMPSYASSLNHSQLWSLVYYLESLVPSDHRPDPNQVIGEEQQGWNAVRMGGMMGGGMMGRGMMHRFR